MTMTITYRFPATIGTITRNFEIVYSNDQRAAIAVLSTVGITDPTLLAAANGALAPFTTAGTVISAIDDAVQSSIRTNASGVMSVVYGDSPVYNSFEVNGAGILANENPNDPKGRPVRVMAAFSDACDQLWRDAIKPFLASARNVTNTLPVRLTAFAAAIVAASPSSSLTAAEALMAAMTPISDSLLGVGTTDPFGLLARRPTPFGLSTLPNLQLT